MLLIEISDTTREEICTVPGQRDKLEFVLPVDGSDITRCYFEGYGLIDAPLSKR